jgi:hypothetical protein
VSASGQRGRGRARTVPRQLDNHQIVFAMGEAIAHLNHLLYQRRVVRETDAHGVLRFRTTH